MTSLDRKPTTQSTRPTRPLQTLIAFPSDQTHSRNLALSLIPTMDSTIVTLAPSTTLLRTTLLTRAPSTASIQQSLTLPQKPPPWVITRSTRDSTPLTLAMWPTAQPTLSTATTSMAFTPAISTLTTSAATLESSLVNVRNTSSLLRPKRKLKHWHIKIKTSMELALDHGQSLRMEMSRVTPASVNDLSICESRVDPQLELERAGYFLSNNKKRFMCKKLTFLTNLF